MGDPVPSTINCDPAEFLKCLFVAKMFLRDHILTEITELVNKRDGILQDLGSHVRVVLSTADAYAKFLAKHSRTSGARILREKTVDVAILDEAQAYELDQVMACIAAPGPGDNKVKTVGPESSDHLPLSQMDPGAMDQR